MAESDRKLRRSLRTRTTVKYSSTKGVVPQKGSRTSSADREHSPDVLAEELANELENIVEDVQKPSELHTDDQDVRAARIYKFQTPSKSGAMAEKAAISRTPATPKHTARQKIMIETAPTPHSLRMKIKRKLASASRRESISESSSSQSESVSEEEYQPSDNEAMDQDDEVVDEEDSDDTDSDTETHPASKKVTSSSKVLSTATRMQSGKSNRCNDYHLKTDEYFESQSAKVITSNRTLGRLANRHLDEENLQQLLADQCHVSKEHKQAIQSLSTNYRTMFPFWYCLMEEGYSLLFHGIGSKRVLINDFYKQVLTDHPTLVINGFFPSLTIKEILDGIIVDLLGLESPVNPNEALRLIEDTLNENPNDRLCILIHNIDGPMLRTEKAQDTLSILAHIPNLYLVASVDHINTPLLWDNVKHSRYNFCWWDTTTYLPYEAETSFESSILAQQSGTLVLSSLRNVFRSLTKNARDIYVLLVNHQLEQPNNATNPGMAFKDLYWGAREAFLVSSDLALRAQLTEFIDHKLVRSKRNLDGTEYLTIPLDNALLKQFLDDQELS